jgi:cell division protein FtsI/penicillin-binding protein 2
MTRALAVLANGGKLVTPHLANAIKEETGITRALGWGEPKQVLKASTVTAVTRMLTEVVDTALANGDLKLEHWSIAAKTGTAQIANPEGGGYYKDRYLHSFFGYFPSYDPKFLVFLFAVEPQGAPFASQTWAPPFKSLTKFLINYYNIPPDR